MSTLIRLTSSQRKLYSCKAPPRERKLVQAWFLRQALIFWIGSEERKRFCFYQLSGYFSEVIVCSRFSWGKISTVAKLCWHTFDSLCVELKLSFILWLENKNPCIAWCSDSWERKSPGSIQMVMIKPELDSAQMPQRSVIQLDQPQSPIPALLSMSMSKSSL